VALSLFLLVGAGLVLKSLARLHAVELGFGAREVARFTISLPSARYDTLPEVAGFVRRLEERLRAIPGTESVGSVYGPPFGSGNIVGQVLVEGRPPPDPADETYGAVHPVTPGYFHTLEIPVLRGRGIEAGDRMETVPVAVVSRSFVQENFPDEDPLGKRFGVTSSFGYRDPNPTWTVVGVVPDVKRTLQGQGWPSVYVPHSQFGPGYMTVHLRGAAGATGLLSAAREEVRLLDPNLALRNVETLDEAVRRNAAPTRFYLTLIGIFAVLAVVLTAVGLYGVVSYLVSRRTREIGVRLALGAREVKILRMVLVQGLRPAALGVVLGLGGAWAGARVAESLLFEVSPRDPLVFGGVTSVLVVVVVLATLVPARRASRVDPVKALRSE
jgi:predicted permease